MNEVFGKIKSAVKNNLLVSLLAVLLTLALALALFFYLKASQTSQSASAAEAEKTVRQVSRHIILPEGETPTVATVTDPEMLKDQPFFRLARPGYKVLIYTNSKKAILYDPIADRIVEVAPLNIEQ